MKLRRIIGAWLSFSRREKNAAILLIVCICIALSFPYVMAKMNTHRPSTNYASVIALLADTIHENKETVFPVKKYEKFTGPAYEKNKVEPVEKAELFYFDPNKITKDDWVRLGVPDYIASRIIHYREKGGVFHNANDLLKTYGFKQEDFDRLNAFIQIDSSLWTKKKNVDESILSENAETDLLPQTKITIEINSATKEQLMQDGADALTATKIIKFRDAVGGFYSLDQVKETFDIPQEIITGLLPFLTINAGEIKKIHLNSATLDELSKHSYIRSGLAQKIIDYRNAYGNFTSISELQKIMWSKDYNKLKPYLEL